MVRRKKQLCSFVILVILNKSLYSQFHTSFSNSNFAGLHSTQLSPSLLAYSPYRWELMLVGAWVNGNNNYLQLNMPHSPYNLLFNTTPREYRAESGVAFWDENWLQKNTAIKTVRANVHAQMRGPAFAMRVGQNWNFSLSTEFNSATRLEGLPGVLIRDLERFSENRNYSPNLAQYENSMRIAVHTHAWVGLGITAARKIEMRHNRWLLLGATYKRLLGLGTAFSQIEWQGFTGIGSNSITTQGGKMEYGFSQTQDENGKFAWGNAIDLGATYVFHKRITQRNYVYHSQKTKYHSKVSIALQDLGAIRYGGGQIVRANWSASQTVEIDTNKLRNLTANEIANNGINQIFRNTDMFQTSNNENRRIGLPSRLVMTYDIQVNRNWFVNLVWQQSLRGRFSQHSRAQSSLMIVPRLERKYFEMGLPVTAIYDYRALRAGIYFRIGPLVLGTNNLGIYLRPSKAKELDFFFALTFHPISLKKKNRSAYEGNLFRKTGKRLSCPSF